MFKWNKDYATAAICYDEACKVNNFDLKPKYEKDGIVYI